MFFIDETLHPVLFADVLLDLLPLGSPRSDPKMRQGYLLLAFGCSVSALRTQSKALPRRRIDISIARRTNEEVVTPPHHELDNNIAYPDTVHVYPTASGHSIHGALGPDTPHTVGVVVPVSGNYLADASLSQQASFNLGTMTFAYARLTRQHYIPCAIGQAGFMTCLADITTQYMEGVAALDFGHVAAMVTIASTLSGGFNAACIRHLEHRFPGGANAEVAMKTLLHYCFVATFINSVWLAGVPVLTAYYGAGQLPQPELSAVLSGWTPEGFSRLMALEFAMFVPYNGVAFKYVPPRIRPLTATLLSATFTIAVSAITLGYFDDLCSRATSLLAL